MPLEIKELVIRAKVSEQTTAPGRNGAASQGVQANKEEIVSACVEQVLEILQSKKER